MPAGYPYKEYPTVFVRGNLQGFQNDRINRDLRSWICQQQLGAPLVSEIISWLSENKEKYREDVPGLLGRRGDPPLSNQSDQFARFFILSHHLCSPVKRGNIIQMAKELHLCGFSTPGKPAVIIVEGRLQSCEEFWKTVRSWQWKRISLRHSDALISNLKDVRSQFNGVDILIDAEVDGLDKVEFYDFVAVLIESEDKLKKFCSSAYRAAKVGGRVAVQPSRIAPSVVARKVRASGFVTDGGEAQEDAVISGTKPSFDGKSVPLRLPTASTFISDIDADIVDENELLEPEDFSKPGSESLKGGKFFCRICTTYSSDDYRPCRVPEYSSLLDPPHLKNVIPFLQGLH
ncbi:unnamed protein product [Heligmosomoides polygyrus]|uniref:DUF1115 domain-containing protein n=1 Tax=Heligmosomoides polygyrus TaxID=6339 RepID=A0A183F6F8_HELPZ|nr:unnamed protein product [Heligmosomoides polygyrus]